jgi:hypothetical protein
MHKNVRLEDSVPATLHVSTTHCGTSLFVLEGTLRGHRCRILVDFGASENFCKAKRVREHHIPTVYGEKYRKNWQMVVQPRLASDYGMKCLL